MKWKNIDCGATYYYITSTFTQWIPLFNYKQILKIVCTEITQATTECNAHISAYVFMPEHLHLLVYLPEEGQLHRYCKLWRGRSARQITSYLDATKNEAMLLRMVNHASGTAKYTVWKEQPRALAIITEQKLQEKVNYIHNNPIRRGLVAHPCEWKCSSWQFYEGDGRSLLPITPWDI